VNFAICSLASGSGGNCYLIKTERTAFLVDAGLSGRQTALRLGKLGLYLSDISAVLVTHEHSDHVKGLPALAKSEGLRFFINKKTYGLLNASYGIGGDSIETFNTGDEIVIEDTQISTFRLSHDAADPVGYSFRTDGKQLSIVTDTGVVTEEIYENVRNSDILVLESNHDESVLKTGRYPWFLKQRILSEEGHLSNEAAADMLKRMVRDDRLNGRIKARRILLAHLSKENNFPEMALATAENVLEAEGVALGKEISVATLPRESISPLFPV
jgi:phosphoribosyl 1,2-cyclic phosphodiesterase